MRSIGLSLLALCIGSAAALAQSNPAPASWQGPRGTGNGVMFKNSGQGVTLQDAGSSLTNFGQLSLVGPSTYSGIGHLASNMGINLDMPSITGTCTQTGPGNDMGCDLNRIAVESDQINAINGRPMYLLNLVHNFGGGAASGSFGGLSVTVQTTGSVAGANPGMEAAQFIVNANANFGGGAGTENGSVFGMNPNVVLGANATHFKQLIGDEIDVAAVAGSSVLYMIGDSVVATSSHAAAASVENTGFMLSAGAKITSNGGTVPGFTMGLSFGGGQGYFPLDASATIIGVHCHIGNCSSFPPGTVTHGIDFSQVNFSSDAFKSPGFTVDGSGNIAAPTLKAPTNGNLGLGNVTNGTGVQVVDDGGPYVNLINLQPGVAGDYDYIWFGGPSSDANITVDFSLKGTGSYSFYTGGSLFGATNRQLLIGAVAGSVNYLQIFGSTAGNPVSMNAGGSDTNVDVQLVPKGTGQLRLAGGSNFSANGSVATVLGSLGPVGSHAAVQKWLVVKDGAGNLLYIPAF